MSVMKFNELLISGYLRKEILSTFYIPFVLTQFITNNVFEKQSGPKPKMNSDTFQWGQYNSYWDKDDIYFMPPKHKNLKRELLENSIFKLTSNEWQQILRSCMLFSKSSICNKIRAKHRPKWNTLLNISCGTIINIKHIIVLKIYSDYDKVSYHFNQVLRGDNHPLKREIAHYTRLIMEAIHLYGVQWSANCNMKLYHAVNSKEHHTNMLYATPYFPFSATSSLHVAKTFATESGSVLQINAVDTKGPIVLDLAFITSYPEERPYVVMSDMLAIDVVHGNNAPNISKSEMEQMRFIQKLLNGSFVVDRNGKPLENTVDSMKVFSEMMTCYIHSKLCRHSSEILSDAQKMFNMFMDRKQCIFINGIQSFKLNTISNIFVRYNYKLISIPTLKWVICDKEYDELVNEHRMIESKLIKADISHLMADEVTFKANCTVNKRGGFEFQLQIIAKPQGVKHVEYEYELFIPLVCYHVAARSSSHCKQYDILQMDASRNNCSSLEINLAIRILKCV